MMHVSFALVSLLVIGSNGYLLGEKEGDANFQRCWMEGQLLVKCPPSLSISWNFSDYENDKGKIIMYANQDYPLKVDVTWNETQLPTVVRHLSPYLIQHMNVHSCIFALGEPCAPHILPDAGSVSHSDVLFSNESNSTFTPHFKLSEGSWNIIAHARLYINDNSTTLYQLVGAQCGAANQVTLPWKLDFAIGTKQDILPEKENSKETTSVAGWQIFVIVIGIAGFLAIAYKVYRYCKNNQMEDLNRLSPAQQVKRALIWELTQEIVSYGLCAFDFITDVLALVDLQTYDKLDPVLVAGYFALVIIVSLFFFGCTYMTMRNIILITNEYKHGIQAVSGENTGSNREKSDSVAERGTLDTEYGKISREIVAEKVALIMGFTEDLPMFAFNLYIVFGENIDGTMLFVSLLINAVMLGYKLSGIQRLWLNMQLKKKLDCALYAIRLSRQNSLDTRQTLSSIKNALLTNQRGEINQGQIFIEPKNKDKDEIDM